MKFSSIIPGIALVLLIAVLCIAGCTTVSPGPGNSGPAPVSPGTTGGSSCGITACHGLDLACGTNAPEVCTMEYRLGDKCRQYARCDTSGGSCTLVKDPAFDTCKACVEKCEANSGGRDPASAFDCEAKC